NIIARMRAVPTLVDQNIAIMNEAIARGWTQPKIVADLVIEQLTAQVAQDASKTPLLAYMQNTYLPKARPGIGIGSLPGGAEAYSVLIRRLTTTTAAPDAIHSIGL